MNLKLDYEKLTNILMDFYTVSHMRVVIYDNEFNRVAAYPEKSCDFCSLLKKNPESKCLCRKNETESCKKCSETNSLYIYKCHAGLTEAVAPIKMNDMILGYIMFGQLLSNESDKNTIFSYGGKYISDKDLLQKSFSNLKVRNDKEIKAIAKIMQACTSYLWISDLIKIDRGNHIYLLTDYINRNLRENLSVDTLCSVLNVSRIKLYELAHKHYGMSIAKYIKQKRVSVAAKILSDSECSVADAANYAGFYDSNYFSKVFKCETGMTPSEYKKFHSLESKTE